MIHISNILSGKKHWRRPFTALARSLFSSAICFLFSFQRRSQPTLNVQPISVTTRSMSHRPDLALELASMCSRCLKNPWLFSELSSVPGRHCIYEINIRGPPGFFVSAARTSTCLGLPSSRLIYRSCSFLQQRPFSAPILSPRTTYESRW